MNFLKISRNSLECIWLFLMVGSMVNAETQKYNEASFFCWMKNNYQNLWSDYDLCSADFNYGACSAFTQSGWYAEGNVKCRENGYVYYLYVKTAFYSLTFFRYLGWYYLGGTIPSQLTVFTAMEQLFFC